MKVFNHKGSVPGEFSWKLRVWNEKESAIVDRDRVVCSMVDEDELDAERSDASEAGELSEDDPDNQQSETPSIRVADFLVYGEIGDQPGDATSLSPKMFSDAVAKAGKVKAFNVHIHSMGGMVLDALAIYNTLESMDTTVNTFVDGMAASSASVIAMAGDSLTMRKNTFLMIHNPFMFAIGDSEEMRKTADVLDQMRDEIANVYKDKTGLPIDTIRKMMDTETWMNARQAKRLGFADAISGRSKIKVEYPKNKVVLNGVAYNLSRFKNVPLMASEPYDGVDWMDAVQERVKEKELADAAGVFIVQPMADKSESPRPETPALTLEELKTKYPEIYNVIVSEGQKAGIESERVRFAELEELRTPATSSLIDKARADGRKAIDIMRECFDAQKTFKPAAPEAETKSSQAQARAEDANATGNIGGDLPVDDKQETALRSSLVDSMVRHGTMYFNSRHSNSNRVK